MKLVIIMLLLIVFAFDCCLRIFLFAQVMGFYIQSFYDQMNDEFQSEEFYISLRDAADDDNGV